MPKLQYDVEAAMRIEDPRDLPAYTLSELSRHLRVPRSKVRSWLGGEVAGGLHGTPIIHLPAAKGRIFSFFNLVEAFLLAGVSRPDIPLFRVREALQAVGMETGWERPLIQEEFQLRGTPLFIERLAPFVEPAVCESVLKDVFPVRFQRIEWQDSLAACVAPFTRREGRSPADRPIVIDYRRSFGRPILCAIGVPTEIIYGRWIGGDTQEEIADDFGCDRSAIEEALCYEAAAQRAA
ncbi:hypothetical protein Pla175_08520 [Pirellulimonas nuda]|uniref:Putative antitoxin VapB45-like DNA-binding HTH domain-containing protein n=1 Tax=Pirellulimonas nuda TaxID=2528009 RepID=A0A518D7N3_9BACT|nr:DUF433 domain-containing protein [Pirellulimonas nuda]QDU87490.1 hypothetical protein Pla175_08520 [Pirellulimonas nuda]